MPCSCPAGGVKRALGVAFITGKAVARSRLLGPLLPTPRRRLYFRHPEHCDSRPWRVWAGQRSVQRHRQAVSMGTGGKAGRPAQLAASRGGRTHTCVLSAAQHCCPAASAACLHRGRSAAGLQAPSMHPLVSCRCCSIVVLTTAGGAQAGRFTDPLTTPEDVATNETYFLAGGARQIRQPAVQGKRGQPGGAAGRQHRAGRNLGGHLGTGQHRCCVRL